MRGASQVNERQGKDHEQQRSHPLKPAPQNDGVVVLVRELGQLSDAGIGGRSWVDEDEFDSPRSLLSVRGHLAPVTSVLPTATANALGSYSTNLQPQAELQFGLTDRFAPWFDFNSRQKTKATTKSRHRSDTNGGPVQPSGTPFALRRAHILTAANRNR
jgi:hypothetical protein